MTRRLSPFISRSVTERLLSPSKITAWLDCARCLAYLLCTESLLNNWARSIEEMRLISTLCSFVEYCGT